MATWGAHIRIAEALIGKHPQLDEVYFLAGNLGPDCGMPNADWSQFAPPKEVSHWYTERGDLDYEDFGDRYIELGGNGVDVKRSFYLGYYSHLMTDSLWSIMFKKQMADRSELFGPLAQDGKFIWTIKRDWYDLDHLYFREHPESLFYRAFVPMGDFLNEFFDFYPEDAFTRQFAHIRQFYLNGGEDLDRDYMYLKKDEMDAFVDEATTKVDERLSSMMKLQ